MTTLTLDELKEIFLKYVDAPMIGRNEFEVSQLQKMSALRQEVDGETYITSSEWVTGGITGGNCWGEGGHEARDAEPYPGFDRLDAFLLELDDIVGLRYSVVVQIKRAVEDVNYTERSYHENSTNSAYRRLPLSKFLEVAAEIGLYSVPPSIGF